MKKKRAKSVAPGVSDFWTRIREAIDTARAGDYFAATMMILKLLAEATLAIGDEPIRTKSTRFSKVDYDAMTEDVLCDKLEKLCDEACPETESSTEDEKETAKEPAEDAKPDDGINAAASLGSGELTAAPKGPFIDAVLPILAALLKKFLGL